MIYPLDSGVPVVGGGRDGSWSRKVKQKEWPACQSELSDRKQGAGGVSSGSAYIKGKW